MSLAYCSCLFLSIKRKANIGSQKIYTAPHPRRRYSLVKGKLEINQGTKKEGLKENRYID
jgi:hypothetical protein